MNVKKIIRYINGTFTFSLYYDVGVPLSF